MVSEQRTFQEETKKTSHRILCLRWNSIPIAHGYRPEVTYRLSRPYPELTAPSPFFVHSYPIHYFAVLILLGFLVLRFLWTHLILKGLSNNGGGRNMSGSNYEEGRNILKVERGVLLGLAVLHFILGMVEDRNWRLLNLVGCHPWHTKESTAHNHSYCKLSV
jgi:hypothetical protein